MKCTDITDHMEWLAWCYCMFECWSDFKCNYRPLCSFICFSRLMSPALYCFVRLIIIFPSVAKVNTLCHSSPWLFPWSPSCCGCRGSGPWRRAWSFGLLTIATFSLCLSRGSSTACVVIFGLNLVIELDPAFICLIMVPRYFSNFLLVPQRLHNTRCYLEHPVFFVFISSQWSSVVQVSTVRITAIFLSMALRVQCRTELISFFSLMTAVYRNMWTQEAFFIMIVWLKIVTLIPAFLAQLFFCRLLFNTRLFSTAKPISGSCGVVWYEDDNRLQPFHWTFIHRQGHDAQLA